MRVLLVQEKSRHKENWEFRECENLSRAFKRAGIETSIWGLGYDIYSIPLESLYKNFDVLFLLENYETEKWIPDLSNYNILKVFWSIDSHWALNPHIRICDFHKIDIVLLSTYQYLDYFKNSKRKCVWFPNAYPCDLIYPMPVEKNGIGFCGNIINRGMWIQKLQNTVGLRFNNFVIGKKMVETINSYKIGWNRCIKDDINYRIFETLGCRTMLITNRVPYLDSLFKIGKDLVTYDSFDECVEKIEYYLNHEEERKNIEESGYQHVLTNHTYDHRVKLFLETIK